LPESTAGTEFTLKHASSDAWALVTTGNTPMPIDTLRHAVLADARREDPDAEIVFEENRIINGNRILCVEMTLTPDQDPLTYFGYYWAGDEGSVRIVTFTEWHLFLRFKDDAAALLDGLVITGKQ
jgi:hypothetical protein